MPSEKGTMILDDKSEHVIPFILECLQSHREEASRNGIDPPPPFFVGLNGVQGAGKTTLVTSLLTTLTQPPHSLPTTVFSLDDLYLTHDDQSALAAAHPSNPLVQHRGVPGTHDLPLGDALFSALARRDDNITIPSYDKSAFSGAGDRRPETVWGVVNREGERSVDVVVFEGWALGFRALEEGQLEQKWAEARAEAEMEGSGYRGRLGKLKLEDIRFVNEKLRGYERLWRWVDAMVHIDAQDTHFVYDWRQQQEAALRAATGGKGMTVEQVNTFVDGYYPCYELYTESLRQGFFTDGEAEEHKRRQLRLVVDKQRKVRDVVRI